MVGKINNYRGFSLIEAIIIAAIIGVIGLSAYLVAGKAGTPIRSLPLSSTQKSSKVIWTQTYDGYKPDGTTPVCSDPIIRQLPADINKVTSVLYPGQDRDGSYRPYGGLRFDNSANDEITVKAPFDGTVIDGGAFIAEGTENDVQYSFDVMNDCGVMYHLGYLLNLSSTLQGIAAKFPPADKSSYQTTQVEPGLKIKAGTVIATAVGTASGKNVFLDFGVYDWRKPNAISADKTWLQNPQHNNAVARHSVCWIELLPKNERAKISSLPAGDPASDKTSDYCR